MLPEALAACGLQNSMQCVYHDARNKIAPATARLTAAASELHQQY